MQLNSLLAKLLRNSREDINPLTGFKVKPVLDFKKSLIFRNCGILSFTKILLSSNNFKFSTDDTDASYSVNGMFVSFIAGGRR